VLAGAWEFLLTCSISAYSVISYNTFFTLFRFRMKKNDPSQYNTTTHPNRSSQRPRNSPRTNYRKTIMYIIPYFTTLKCTLFYLFIVCIGLLPTHCKQRGERFILLLKFFSFHIFMIQKRMSSKF